MLDWKGLTVQACEAFKSCRNLGEQEWGRRLNSRVLKESQLRTGCDSGPSCLPSACEMHTLLNMVMNLALEMILMSCGLQIQLSEV